MTEQLKDPNEESVVDLRSMITLFKTVLAEVHASKSVARINDSERVSASFWQKSSEGGPLQEKINSFKRIACFLQL